MKVENKYKNKSCWTWRDIGTINSKAEDECKNCTSKKCERRLLQRKIKRTNINQEELIEQITVQLNSTCDKELLLNVSNLVLGTNFSTEKHRLISRL